MIVQTNPTDDFVPSKKEKALYATHETDKKLYYFQTKIEQTVTNTKQTLEEFVVLGYSLKSMLCGPEKQHLILAFLFILSDACKRNKIGLRATSPSAATAAASAAAASASIVED